MIPSFRGARIRELTVDRTLCVELDNGWTLTGECGCSLVRSGHESIGVDLGSAPEGARANLAGALGALRGTELADVLVTRTGHIGLVMAGAQLVLTPHADYESWILSGPQSQRAVCLPGGQVEMWLTAPEPDGESEEAGGDVRSEG